jgi:hypothetical protein
MANDKISIGYDAPSGCKSGGSFQLRLIVQRLCNMYLARSDLMGIGSKESRIA